MAKDATAQEFERFDEDDYVGSPVSEAGDVNGDDFADLIVGAYGTDLGGRISAGETYVIYGQNGYLANIDLATLTINEGFTISKPDFVQGRIPMQIIGEILEAALYSFPQVQNTNQLKDIVLRAVQEFTQGEEMAQDVVITIQELTNVVFEAVLSVAQGEVTAQDVVQGEVPVPGVSVDTGGVLTSSATADEVANVIDVVFFDVLGGAASPDFRNF